MRFKERGQKMKSKKRTPMGRLQGEERHSPCRRIQAASLIFVGLQANLESQTFDPILVSAPDSC